MRFSAFSRRSLSKPQTIFIPNPNSIQCYCFYPDDYSSWWRYKLFYARDYFINKVYRSNINFKLSLIILDLFSMFILAGYTPLRFVPLPCFLFLNFHKRLILIAYLIGRNDYIMTLLHNIVSKEKICIKLVVVFWSNIGF